MREQEVNVNEATKDHNMYRETVLITACPFYETNLTNQSVSQMSHRFTFSTSTLKQQLSQYR